MSNHPRACFFRYLKDLGQDKAEELLLQGINLDQAITLVNGVVLWITHCVRLTNAGVKVPPDMSWRARLAYAWEDCRGLDWDDFPGYVEAQWEEE